MNLVVDNLCTIGVLRSQPCGSHGKAAVLQRRDEYERVVSDFFPPAINAATSFGKLLGLPINTQVATVYFYNKEIVAASGMPEPREGWTWDDLEEYGRRGTLYGNDGPTQWGVGAQHARTWVAAAGLQNDAPFFSADGRTFLPNPQGMVETLDWSRDLIERGLILELWQDGRRFAREGRVGIYLDGTYRLPELRTGGFAIGVAPPLIGKKAGADAANHALFAFKTGDAAREEASVTFITWFAEAPQAARYVIAWGDLGARRSALVHPNYAPEEPEIYQVFHQYIPIYTEQYGNPVFPTVDNTWRAYLDKVVRGEMPAQAAVESAIREIQPYFDEYYSSR